MNKVLKVILLILGVFLLLILSTIIYLFSITSHVKLDVSKLVDMDRTITYYDSNGYAFTEEFNQHSVTNLHDIPTYTKNAFIAIEDKRFYSHHGVDYKGLFRALLNNIKSFSFKQGASTISQQLIKNTHLTNEKTFKRKLYELKLAKQLENNFTKDEILEKYLNTIYFGDGCYGITSASKHYFNKSPKDLTVNESAILAGIIKAPSHYSPINKVENCIKRKNVVLNEMYNQGYIDLETYNKNKSEGIELSNERTNETYGFMSLARKELQDIIKNSPYSFRELKVYTSLNKNAQEVLEKHLINTTDYNNAIVLYDKENNVIAYASTCIEDKRQIGSTIKPLLVYAPAIETDTIYSCTQILDEKTNFNGYCPSNFNDKYHGYVSAKDSLAKSLNVCSVKILNSVGIDRAKSFLEKTEIKLSDQDNSLCLALGATTNGEKLTTLTSAYSVFLNNGNYQNASIIDTIICDNNQILYKKDKKQHLVFSAGTVDVLNDMLYETVKSGTAKKLSRLNFPLYAKTGTIGNDKGNTDAYTISFSSDYILGSWCGCKGNTLMNNSVSGGNTPASQSSFIWEELYKDNMPNELYTSDECVSEMIDLATLINEHKVVLADNNAPENQKTSALFKKNSLPKICSNAYTNPKIKTPVLSVNNKHINIQLCLPQYINCKIFRTSNNIKLEVFDSIKDTNNFFIDYNALPNIKYTYTALPYYKTDNKIFYGEEIYIDSIRLSNSKIDNWWNNEFE